MRALILSIFVVCILFTPHVWAQDFIGSDFGQDNTFSGQNKPGQGVVNQYSNKYQKGQNPIELNHGLVPESRYNILFVRQKRSQDNQDTDYFNTPVLRMTSQAVINGCVKITQPTANIRRNGSVLYIEVQDPVIMPDKSVQYAHFQCNQGNHLAQLDVPLDVEELRENDVRTISIKAGNYTDYFEVNLSDKALILSPKTRTAFTPFHYPHIINPLDFPFYPKDVVVLSVPQATPGDALAESVHKLASEKELTPLDDDFALNIKTENMKQFYFQDVKATLDQSVKAGEQVHIGEIKVPETLYGPDGAYQVGKKLAVYARLPHQLD